MHEHARRPARAAPAPGSLPVAARAGPNPVWARLATSGRLPVSAPGDAAEREADRIADAVTTGGPAPAPTIGAVGVVQRQDAPKPPSTWPVQETAAPDANEEKLKEGLKKFAGEFGKDLAGKLIDSPNARQLLGFDKGDLESLKKEFEKLGESTFGAILLALGGGVLTAGAVAGTKAQVDADAADATKKAPPDQFQLTLPNAKFTEIKFTWDFLSSPSGFQLITPWITLPPDLGAKSAPAGGQQLPPIEFKPRAKDPAVCTPEDPQGDGGKQAELDAIMNALMRQRAAENQKMLDDILRRSRTPLGPQPGTVPEYKPNVLFKRDGAGGGSADAGVVRAGVESPGEALAGPVRARMEAGLGRDLSAVRVHTGSGAAASAAALSAQAFTVGRDVVFAAGRFDPHTPAGQRLLAHELVHTVQQDGPTPTVRRFGSTEHRDLGDTASGGLKTDLDIGGGVFLSYGEMVALAGDYFASLDEMRKLAATPDGQQQLQWAKWKALGGTEPAVPEDIKTKVMNRYFTLAATNISHFSAGGTARTEYQKYHSAALGLAFRAGMNAHFGPGPSPGEAEWKDAVTTEAFGHHYLTDSFSGGHVRTQRDAIKKWYAAKFPNSIDQFVHAMAQFIYDDLLSKHPVMCRVMCPSVAELEKTIQSLGGPALAAFTLGDIVSLALHDKDNEGLNVVSRVDESGKAGPFKWRAVGDNHLATEPVTAPLADGVTTRMARAAVAASLAELTAMRAAGKTAAPANALLGPTPGGHPAFAATLAKMTPFAAEGYIPAEDTAAGNVAMVWEWGMFNKDMRDAVDAAVRAEICPVLDSKAGGVANVEARAAFTAFVNKLRAAPTDEIQQIVGVNAGPS